MSSAIDVGREHYARSEELERAHSDKRNIEGIGKALGLAQTYSQPRIAARAHTYGHCVELERMFGGVVKTVFYKTAQEHRMVAAAEILAMGQYHALSRKRGRACGARCLYI